MRKFVWSALLAGIVGMMMVGGTVHGQNPPPPPPPYCGTPPAGGAQPNCSPASPTPTPSPTATSTPVPLTLSVQLAHGTVAPRSTQKVSVTTNPSASVVVLVQYPNHNRKQHNGKANASGKMTWSYVQPGSRITHSSRTTKVTVTVSGGGASTSATKRYTIAFAALDVSAEPRTQKPGGTVTIWAHTKAFTTVSITLQRLYTVQIRTGANGWGQTRLVLSSSAPRGRVAVTGRAVISGRAVSGLTSFQVR